MLAQLVDARAHEVGQAEDQVTDQARRVLALLGTYAGKDLLAALDKVGEKVKDVFR